jgi:hypothetical protein
MQEDDDQPDHEHHWKDLRNPAGWMPQEQKGARTSQKKALTG